MTRILLDQGLPKSGAAVLKAAKWEVVHAQEIGLATTSDAEIIQYARHNQWTLVTLRCRFSHVAGGERQQPPLGDSDSARRIARVGIGGSPVADLAKLSDGDRFWRSRYSH